MPEEGYKTQPVQDANVENSLETFMVNEESHVGHTKLQLDGQKRRIVSAATKATDSANKTRPSTAYVPISKRTINREDKAKISLKHSIIVSHRSRVKSGRKRPKTGVSYFCLLVIYILECALYLMLLFRHTDLVLKFSHNGRIHLKTWRELRVTKTSK